MNFQQDYIVQKKEWRYYDCFLFFQLIWQPQVAYSFHHAWPIPRQPQTYCPAILPVATTPEFSAEKYGKIP